MAQAPRPGTTRPEAELPTFAITWDGTTVTVDAKSIPFGAWAKIGRAARRYVREEVAALTDLTDEERAIEVVELEQFVQVPAIVWWTLQRAGIDVTLGEIVDNLEIGAVADALPAEDESPEA